MQDLKGKTAFITGAGRGIGRGIAVRLAAEGVHLALTDIQENLLEETAAEAASHGVKVKNWALDVADRAPCYRVADEVEAEFGKLHILVNNAGVGYFGTSVDKTEDADFDWVMGVNVDGVFNGIKAFVPLIKKHGEGGHVVNTASIGGLVVSRGSRHGTLYSATKMAVVALSEGLDDALRPLGIGVSVLCPGAVDTAIYHSGRIRPGQFGGPVERDDAPDFRELLATTGVSPDWIGICVVAAIQAGDVLHILTHPKSRDMVSARHAMLMAAYDRSERLLATLPPPR